MIARIVIVGGLATAALVLPALVDGPDHLDAQCTAVFGSRNDGICLDGPTAPAPDFPSFGLGPNANGTGPGISTSPLFPGQTVDIPMG